MVNENATAAKSKEILRRPPICFSLLVTQGLYGIEAGGASRGVKARRKAHKKRKEDGECHQPPRNRPEMFWWKRLTLQINIRSQIDDLTNRPSQRDSDDAAQNAHRARLREEQFLHIPVAGSNGLHNADFAAALEDGHHQRVYDSDESDSQSEAAEDSQKHVQHFEKLLDAAAGIEDRKGIESHLFDGIFHGLNLAGVLHSHTHRRINRLAVGGARNLSQVGRLHYVQALG